jgi:hypothetical protein
VQQEKLVAFLCQNVGQIATRRRPCTEKVHLRERIPPGPAVSPGGPDRGWPNWVFWLYPTRTTHSALLNGRCRIEALGPKGKPLVDEAG